MNQLEKVRALARGEYGELHIGYAPSPTVKYYRRHLRAFQKSRASCESVAP